jgi:hypothetical protein
LERERDTYTQVITNLPLLDAPDILIEVHGVICAKESRVSVRSSDMRLAIQICQPGKGSAVCSYGALRLLPSLRKQVVLPDSSLINVSHGDHQGRGGRDWRGSGADRQKKRYSQVTLAGVRDRSRRCIDNVKPYLSSVDAAAKIWVAPITLPCTRLAQFKRSDSIW